MDRAKDRGRKAGRRHLACAPSTRYEFHLAPGPRKDIGRMAEQLSACGTIRWKGQVDSGIDGTSAKRRTDRKSTRLNSSHTVISYAVFCLKKKKKKKKQTLHINRRNHQ